MCVYLVQNNPVCSDCQERDGPIDNHIRGRHFSTYRKANIFLPPIADLKEAHQFK